MSRAYGWNARMLLGFETAYGTPPNSGAFHVIPFVSSDLDSAQGLIESNVLGLGREATLKVVVFHGAQVYNGP